MLKADAFPEIFQHPQFKGQVYSLNEMVIDVNALIRELVKPHQDVIFKINPIEAAHLQLAAEDKLDSIEIHAAPMKPVKIHAQKFILLPGSGNDVILKKINHPSIGMQKRPLHMVLVKHDYPFPLYAHCMGLDLVPRITITSHQAQDGKMVWYLGGQLAEEGVKRDPIKQIEVAKKELSELFPWLDFSRVQISTFFIDRAEALQADGKRPDACYFKNMGNVIVTWPTKLAFSPLLTEQVMQYLQQENIQPLCSDIRALRAWPIPAFAAPIWDELLL